MIPRTKGIPVLELERGCLGFWVSVDSRYASTFVQNSDYLKVDPVMQLPSEVLPCIIDFRTEAWLAIVLSSFFDHVSTDRFLVVDNNRESSTALPVRFQNDPRIEVVRYGVDPERARIPPLEGVYGHGPAMDFAARAALSRGFKYLLHIEPDCLILGTEWLSNLLEKRDHFSMVGIHRKMYGPIHPTPSLWRLDRIPCSFCQQPRGTDEQHSRFPEVFDKPKLLTAIQNMYDPKTIAWFDKNWDTAQRAWFLLAIENRAARVSGADFTHYWCGSARAPDYEQPEFARFLRS